MRFRKIGTGFATFLASILLLGTAVAKEPISPQPTGPSVPPLPPGALNCNVDPAVMRIVLAKTTRPNEVTVTYEVRNLGTQTWRSTAGTAHAVLTFSNLERAAGFDFENSQNLPTTSAAGTIMIAYTSRPLMMRSSKSPEAREFGQNRVVLTLTYDDLGLARNGRVCNADISNRNNSLSLDGDQIDAFLDSRDRSRTFAR